MSAQALAGRNLKAHVPPRQAQVLQFINSQIQSPTIREIGEHLGVSSPATVHKHLRMLQKKRLVDWTPHAQRSLTTVYRALRAVASDALRPADTDASDTAGLQGRSQ